jgi:hypothetical protein
MIDMKMLTEMGNENDLEIRRLLLLVQPACPKAALALRAFGQLV